MPDWIIGRRHNFVAVKEDTPGDFICLHQVIEADTLKPFRHHVWIRKTKRFRDVPNDEPFYFSAKVNTYQSKGERKLTLTNINLFE